MAERTCPNCGYPLVPLLTERQPAGHRDVTLQWVICERCRHVGLRHWSFADGPLPEPRSPESRRAEARFLRLESRRGF